MCSTTSSTQMGMFLFRIIAYNITARMCWQGQLLLGLVEGKLVVA